MKSVVLLSSGIDSTVNFYEAHTRGRVLLALTFDYGQRAAPRELACAHRLAQDLNIPHRVVELPFFKEWGRSSLVNSSLELPQGDEVSIDDMVISQETAKSVWVPNRNGIFLNIAAGFAESLGAEVVIPGFNLEEAATFPDNSQAFLQALTQSFSYSTANQVKVQCFTTGLRKSEIVRRGIELNIKWDQIWPCYQAFEKWCGECESCQRAKRAFAANQLSFPPRTQS